MYRSVYDTILFFHLFWKRTFHEDMWRRYCCLTVFPMFNTCLSCEDIAQQSCAMVRRWRFFVEFLRPVFSPIRVQHISDPHSKFALRPHHVVNVQSTATENRQGKTRKKEYYIIMVALWNRADHYIFVRWFLLPLLLSFFFSSPNLSHRRLDVCHLGTIAQLCRAISSQLRHISTIGKIVKQQYLLHVSSQYGELRPTNG